MANLLRNKRIKGVTRRYMPVALLGAVVAVLTPTAKTTDDTEDALLSVAHQCAKDLTSNSSCILYTKDEKQEYVIIKDHDPEKPAAYLIIPVARVTGIEDSQILSAFIQDLWESAWLWSRKYPGKPWAQTALAINSIVGRSQNQLHIHIACVLPKVSHALARRKVPTDPANAIPLKLGPHQNTYWGALVTGLRGRNSPFRVIQKMPGVNKNDMKDQSIVVVGSRMSGEYYILKTTADGTNTGHAEELLDQTCSIR